VEIITRGERRRRWTVEQKRDIVAKSYGPDLTPTEVARKHGCQFSGNWENMTLGKINDLLFYHENEGWLFPLIMRTAMKSASSLDRSDFAANTTSLGIRNRSRAGYSRDILTVKGSFGQIGRFA